MPSTRPAPVRTPWSVQAAVAGLAVFVLVSRLVYLTSSTNMWDSCSFVEMVRTVADRGVPQVYLNLETGHSLYVQLCAVTVGLTRLLGGPQGVLFGMKLTGIVLVALSVWPLFWLARWLFGAHRPALWAAAIYTVIPILWWWSGETMSDAAGLAFLVAAFGWLARWLEGRSPYNLALACLVFGANPLVRFGNLSALPLFGLLGLLGLWQRRSWKPLLLAALIPLPVLIASAIELALQPYRSWADLFAMTPQNAMDLGQLVDSRRWQEIAARVTHALGIAGLAAAALGVVSSLVLRRTLLLFVLLWTAPFFLPQVVLPQTVIRYWIPLVPVVALLAAAGLEGLRRLPAGRLVSAGGGGLLLAALVLHALPVLRALHERESVLDAIPRWYREHTEPGSLLLTDVEHMHVATFARDREAVYFEPDVYTMPWVRHVGKPLPETLWRIDRALEQGRSVYATGLMHWKHMKRLKDYYDFVPHAVLPGRTVRNVLDAGYGFMDGRMTDERDVDIYRLQRIDPARWKTCLQAAPPPEPRVQRHGDTVTLSFTITCPEGARGLGFGLLSESALALDWAHEPTLGQDRVLLAGLRSFLQRIVYLDERGRGQVTIEVPRLEGPPISVLHVSYAVIDPHGFLSHIAVPVRIEL